jgi:hypothetical protein
MNNIKEYIYRLGIGNISNFLNHFLQEILEPIPSIILSTFFWIRNSYYETLYIFLTMFNNYCNIKLHACLSIENTDINIKSK